MHEFKFIEVKATGPFVSKGFVTWIDHNGKARRARCIKFTQEFYCEGVKVRSQKLLNCMVGNEV